jgi:hypothetical protein
MADGMNLLITIKHKSVFRRFWRELGSLIRWGLQDRVYKDSDAPFSVLGHEHFRVSKKHGRGMTDEVEIVFFESMKGPLKDRWSGPQLSRMEREMREAVAEVARQHGYAGVYYRERKPTAFIA